MRLPLTLVATSILFSVASAQAVAFLSTAVTPATPWTTSDGKVMLMNSVGSFGSGADGSGAYGGSSPGTNANAFDHGDAATMILTFAADAGLTEVTTGYSRASAVISGFTTDPMVTAGPSGLGCPPATAPEPSPSARTGTAETRCPSLLPIQPLLPDRR
jgi:hypothetical protein